MHKKGIITYEEKLEELPIFLNEDHVNEIYERADELNLDKPMFLIRQNPITMDFEGVEVTQKILDFIKENKEEDLAFDIYIGYTFKEYSFEEMEKTKLQPNQDLVVYDEITDDFLVEEETKFLNWEPDENEKALNESVMNAIKAFHNMKWHNGEQVW